MFGSEQEMSICFERYLKANFGNTYLKECQGLFGIPDFVFYSKQSNDITIISFELKLKDWKRASKQAFRYKSFSNIAYVVLPSDNVKAASDNIEFFQRYNIGLAKFSSKSEFEILFKPLSSKPYSDSLNQKLEDIIINKKRSFRNYRVSDLITLDDKYF